MGIVINILFTNVKPEILLTTLTTGVWRNHCLQFIGIEPEEDDLYCVIVQVREGWISYRYQ